MSTEITTVGDKITVTHTGRYSTIVFEIMADEKGHLLITSTHKMPSDDESKPVQIGTAACDQNNQIMIDIL